MLRLISLFLPALLFVQGANWSQVVPATQTQILQLDVAGLSPLEALLQYGDLSKTPMAIVISKPSLYLTKMDVDILRGSPEHLLKQVLSSAPGYTSVLHNGLLTIAVPDDLTKNNLLTHRLKRYKTFRQETATRASAELWGILQLEINPKRKGFGGVLRVPANDTSTLPTFDKENVTVQDILDLIVLTKGKMAWLSWPPPTSLIDEKEYNLWNLIFYNEKNSNEKLCCIYPPVSLTNLSDEVRKRLAP